MSPLKKRDTPGPTPEVIANTPFDSADDLAPAIDHIGAALHAREGVRDLEIRTATIGAPDVYGSAVFPNHAELLAASGITPKVAQARRYRSADTKAQLERLGFARAQRRPPGLLLPTWSSITRSIAGWQLRPDDPRVDQRRSRVVKYETAAERPLVVDAHPFTWGQLGDPSTPLFITEGIRKADAAVSAGLCCVALLGVWNWRGSNDKGGTTALPEWEAIALNNGRRVYIVFDSDVVTKREVHQALVRLRAYLEARGSEVFVVYLPAGDGGEKVGLDDFLAAGHGIDDLLALASPELHASNNPLSGDVDDKVMPSPGAPYAVAGALAEQSYRDADGTLLLRWWRGGFYRWNRTSWVEADEAAVRAELYPVLAPTVWVTPKGELAPWNPNRNKIADVLAALAALAHTPQDVETPSWLKLREGDPSAHELVAVGNGLLHVPTRQLHEHTPRFFNVVAVPFSYEAQAVVPERWVNFLHELWPDDPEAIACLQEFFGYVISGDTRMHKILFILGPMRSGKGTIARVLESLVGHADSCGPTLASLGTNFGLQPLIGKSLAIVSDARLGTTNANIVVERLLSISGEDALSIDRKFRAYWFGKLGTRFVIASNELPGFGDASGAIASRFLVLTLTQSWLGREDHELTDKILQELPGILNWALDGLDRLRVQDRFTEPASSRDAIVTLQDAVSPISAFVRERCLVGGDHEVGIDQIYQEWRSWCEEQGRDRPGTKASFAKNLRAVVPGLRMERPRVDGERERRYRGITLRNDSARDQQSSGPRTNPDHRGAVRDANLQTTRSKPVVRGGPSESAPSRVPVSEGDHQAPRDVPNERKAGASETGQHDGAADENLDLQRDDPSSHRRVAI
jgi:putative DNA primase/helicase